MARINRFVYVLVLLVAVILLFNSSWSISSHRKRRSTHAEQRLMNFVDSIAPMKVPFRPDTAYDPPHNVVIQKLAPKSTLNMFPLGLGTKTQPMPPRTLSPRRPKPAGRMFNEPRPGDRHEQAPLNVEMSAEEAKNEVLGVVDDGSSQRGTGPADGKQKEHFDASFYEFQQDVDVPDTINNVLTYAKYRPHNYNSEPGHPTFATYFCSRQSSMHDPYFTAVQALIYRNLWAPKSASKKHPFTVFVAPHILQDQRDVFTGAGAIVRELPLVKWDPPVKDDIFQRWSDLFAKLGMWRAKHFSRIAFMDSDAFPIQNIDDVFEISEERRCNQTLFEEADSVDLWDEACNYTFSAVEIFKSKQFNVGLMVLSPDRKMHARLLRNYERYDMYDNKLAEQGFLNWQFNETGPFPVQYLPRAYNGFFPQADENETLKVVHEKIWTPTWDLAPWIKEVWTDTWDEMKAFYASAEFKRARERDEEPARLHRKEQAIQNRKAIENRFKQSSDQLAEDNAKAQLQLIEEVARAHIADKDFKDQQAQEAGKEGDPLGAARDKGFNVAGHAPRGGAKLADQGKAVAVDAAKADGAPAHEGGTPEQKTTTTTTKPPPTQDAKPTTTAETDNAQKPLPKPPQNKRSQPESNLDAKAKAKAEAPLSPRPAVNIKLTDPKSTLKDEAEAIELTDTDAGEPEPAPGQLQKPPVVLRRPQHKPAPAAPQEAQKKPLKRRRTPRFDEQPGDDEDDDVFVIEI